MKVAQGEMTDGLFSKRTDYIRERHARFITQDILRGYDFGRGEFTFETE